MIGRLWIGNWLWVRCAGFCTGLHPYMHRDRLWADILGKRWKRLGMDDRVDAGFVDFTGA